MTDSNLPGQKALAPFFEAFGWATARWQHVEAALCTLTHALLDTDFKYSSAVFFHIRSPDSKVQLVDRLCRAHFDDETLASEWFPLCKHLREAVDNRNQIAHYEVNFILDLSFLEPGEPPVALTPHHLRDPTATKAATTNTLRQLAENYLALSSELLHFSARHFELERLRATHLPPRLLRYLEKLQNPNNQDDPGSPPPPPQS